MAPRLDGTPRLDARATAAIPATAPGQALRAAGMPRTDDATAGDWWYATRARRSDVLGESLADRRWSSTVIDTQEAVRTLVEEYRHRCFWFLRPDFVPRTRDEMIRALGYIKRYGDREGYLRAERIERWLSQPSRPTS